jgi:CubicO group peptidase (beta-lactamase class C family)
MRLKLETLKVFFFIIILFFLQSCYLIHTLRWQNADMQDYKKFPSKMILKPLQSFSFIAGKEINASSIKISPKVSGNNDFDDLLKKTNTLSFLIIRNDSLLYEKYFPAKDENILYPSFSVSKSFVSALVGIAIDEGYIKNENQPITDYLTDLKGEGFKKITIKHLLNMKTGLGFSENYSSPFADVVRYYYGPNLKRYLKHLKVKEEPGMKYDYVSVSSLLLSLIVEKATGTDIVVYLQNKIWNPLGMEFEANWSVDSKKHQVVKSFCCLNAQTIDFAKLGRLYLYKGNWNGKQIISKEWAEKSITYSKDSTCNFYYNYQWRVGNMGDFFAKGALGQFIYVNPDKNIIIVRNGNEYGINNWEDVFREIAYQL